MSSSTTFKEHPVTDIRAGLSSEVSDFGALLKAFRVNKGKTQLALTREAGLSRGYVANVEGGQRGHRPGREIVLALAAALNLTNDEQGMLLKSAGWEITQLPSSLAEITFAEYVRTLPDITPSQQELMISLYDEFRGRKKRR